MIFLFFIFFHQFSLAFWYCRKCRDNHHVTKDSVCTKNLTIIKDRREDMFFSLSISVSSAFLSFLSLIVSREKNGLQLINHG